MGIWRLQNSAKNQWPKMPGATSPKRTVQTSGRGTLICPYFGKSLSDPIFKQLSSETFFVLSSWLTHTVRHCSFILGRKDPRAWGKSWNLSFQRYSRRPTESWRQSRVPFHVGLGFHWRPHYWQSESRRNFPRWNPPLPWQRDASHQRRTRNVPGRQQPKWDRSWGW